MKYFEICILLSIICLQQASIVLSNANDYSGAKECCDNIHPVAREKYVLPKIYDFESFKRLFKKDYPSMIENLFRKKIYLSKSFRAYISSVRYKLSRSDHYFAVNHMSDWSRKELYGVMLDQKYLIVPEARPLPAMENIRNKRNIDNAKEDHLSDEVGLTVVQEILSDDYNVADFDQQVPDRIDHLGKPTRATSFGANSKRSSQQHDWEARQDAKLIKQNPLSPVIQKSYAMLSRISPRKRFSSGDKIEVDHRRSNCFPPAKSQGRCGSCFIFAAISLYEWHYCKATGHRKEFSEQYVIDCGDKAGISGCDGGALYDISRFIKEFGIELSSNFPNTNLRDQKCPYSESAPPNSMGYLRPKDSGSFVSIPHKDIKEFLRQAPIAMYLHTNEDFYDYGGGVDNARGCNQELVHAMLLVGSGREDGQNYWLFRNSFSSDWGQDGYYKLNRKSTECLHLDFGAVLDVNFGPSLSSDINPNYDGLPARVRKEQL